MLAIKLLSTLINTKLTRIIALIGICAYANPSWGICVVDLPTKIAGIVQTPQLKSARVGVYASKLDNLANPIVNIDGDKYFTPASNLKLFTTAAALEILGKGDRIKTSLWLDQNRETLWLKVEGDPSFTEDNLKSLVKSLAQYLHVNGIRAISGNIKTSTQIRGSGIGQGWQWEDLQEDYAAIANAFILNENVLDWTTAPTRINQPIKFSWDRPDLAQGWIIDNRAITVDASIPNSLKIERSQGQNKLIITGNLPQNTPPELGATAVPDSESHFLRLLRSEMIKQGIKFKPELKNLSKNLLENQSMPAIAVATIFSPPLAELINTTNKQSNNLYAESLLNRIGSFSNPDSELDSREQGIDIITKFLADKGISAIVMADGSGLSNLSLVTPKTIAQLLTIMKDNSIFRDSLPIAGVDGTLKNRLQSFSNIQAKTGTLTGVAALSGYIQPPKYPEIGFSIIINNSTLSNRELTQNLDAIAQLLSSVEVCNSVP
ncbi:D-alanyl-D-alanine carboxypeptidase, serine-type, PBP4 family [Synechococcus sp. PCC 7502]|uniref:D-alanyl-D-alanine carboxypeptidase/D-alanyl-D-alanine endopeptidase n=1 Tax=Synechococcus sp. PCC 7502 TaxID=1173263 RepID=UPI00029FDCB1|nr:D-alanyl-D-alanine carboxypeptidase/D-alanyl-D-alanine-endopeptidase [Synechococcus sp. PCC 7502]AFY72607.1 D-alanyl-D-alanine carboxypeptidase, serine-type, PBP4 family [Synechococcus sp. PCC 7502]